MRTTASVGLRAASRALRPRCCVLSGSSTCQQMHETSVGSLKPGRRRGRTEQDAVQNRREDPLSHATLTNPTSSPSCFRALTQPRLEALTLLHHPTLGVPPWDSTRLIISSSATASRQEYVVSSATPPLWRAQAVSVARGSASRGVVKRCRHHVACPSLA